MSEHIVIVLHPQDLDKTFWRLHAALRGILLEPQFHNLLPKQVGEVAALSEMRRTVRLIVPLGTDADTLVQMIRADLGVECVYRENEAQPA